MSGMPTTLVKLDDGTGTYPYDVTSFVRRVDGITWSRGRGDELSENSPGTLNLTLDNTDGRFTLGSTSGGYGAINVDRGIRVSANGTTRFTGFVQSWPVSWPGGGDTFCVVQATATDNLARLARRILRTSIEEEIVVANPAAFYTLSEAAGATQAGDSSGLGAPPLAITGTGAALAFGNGTGPPDGLTCVSFAGGKFLRNALPATYAPAGNGFTLECFFATTLTPASVAPILMLSNVEGFSLTVPALFITAAGKLEGFVAGAAPIISAASVNDGLVHHAVLTVVAGGGAIVLYLDGVNVGSSSGAIALADLISLSIAPSDGGFAGATPYVGTVAHAACYTGVPLAVARVVAHNTAGTTDFFGETAQTRINRVKSYVGVGGIPDGGGTTLMGPRNQNGRSIADILAEVGQATFGSVWVNEIGDVESLNGWTVVGQSTPAATLDANWFGQDTSATVDMFGVVNYGTGKATGSENVATAQNAASITSHGAYRQDFEWNVSTDDQVLDRLNWTVSAYAEPQPRVATLTLDLLTATPAVVTAALALKIMSFLRVTGLPTQTPGGTSRDVIIEGIAETVSTTEWTLTFNVSQRILRSAWVLDDPVYSILDSTTKLYFG